MILTTLKHNLTLVIILSALIITNVFSYYTGHISRDTEVDTLTQEMNNIHAELGIKSDLLDGNKHEADEIKAKLNRIKNSRVYMTALIEKEANVEIPERVDINHLRLMFKSADKHDIPYKIYFRLIQKESRYKWWVESSAGAKGYMQMMPRTYSSIANKLNQPSEMTAKSNIICGSYYLRSLYDDMFDKVIHKKVYDLLDFNMETPVKSLNKQEYKAYKKECDKIKSDKTYYNNHNVYIWELALSSYNAGPGNVSYTIPNIPETQGYVKFILNPYYAGI